LNIDGYDDLLMTLRFEQNGKPNFNKSLVLLSYECVEGACHQSAVERKIPRRYFNVSDNKIDLPVIQELAGDNSVMLVPMDIDEDGRMDILVQRNVNGVYGLSLIYNNY
jgi:hypothetical protein